MALPVYTFEIGRGVPNDRPKCSERGKTCNRKIMKICQPIKLEMMWNEAICQHFRQSPFCHGDLCFDKDGESKIGICWQERLKCERCQYVSATHKLYDEVESQKRGPNPAAPNIAVQMGLLHTSTGNTGLCQLLNAANIAAPAKSSLQKKANEVKPSNTHAHRTIRPCQIKM